MADVLVCLRLSIYIWCCCVFVYFCSCDREMYIDLEHPVINYLNPKYFDNYTIVNRRHSRKDPQHYTNVYFRSLKEVDKEFMIHLYIYELLTNVYKRSFVEFHVNYCDLIENDTVIGVFFRNKIVSSSNKLHVKCPLLAGDYSISNLSIPPVPLFQQFPFQKGRIYVNFTRNMDKEKVAQVHADMTLKPYPRYGRKNPLL